MLEVDGLMLVYDVTSKVGDWSICTACVGTWEVAVHSRANWKG